MKNDYYEDKTENKIKYSFNLSGSRIAFGLLLIACAILMILDAVGISLGFLSGIPAFTVFLSALIVYWFFSELFKLRLWGLFFPLAFLFMVLEKHIAKWCGLPSENIINNWLVLLAASLLAVGVALLKPKRIARFSKKDGYRKSSVKGTKTCGSSTVYVDCGDGEKTVEVSNKLGSCDVYFSSIEEYDGNKTLIVHNELGSMTINVPSGWKINSSVNNDLGSISEPYDKAQGDITINIEGTNSLGSLSITRV